MANNKLKHKSALSSWIEAMRLRTLPVSVAGVLAGYGSAAAMRSANLGIATICMLFAIIAQIASNFANEYYDWKKGVDRPGREGFRRGVTEGDITPLAMKRATYYMLCLDAIVGCSLIWFGGWWLIFVGLLIGVFAVAYSAGPWPLSHKGLGDIAVIIFFGLVPVMFTAYVQAGPDVFSSPLCWCVGTGIGMLAANVLIVNNYRDMEDDIAVGKKTTVVRFGRPVMSAVYLTFAYLGIFLLNIWLPHGLSIMTVAESILATALWFKLRKSRGTELNPLLGMTASMLLLFAVVFTFVMVFMK